MSRIAEGLGKSKIPREPGLGALSAAVGKGILASRWARYRDLWPV